MSSENAQMVLAIRDKKYDEAKKLLDKGADPTTVVQGQSGLFWAAHNNNTEMFKLMLHKGCPVTKANHYGGWTELHWAAKFGNIEIMRLALSNGVSIDAQSGQAKKTALMMAAETAHVEAVRVLLEEGANTNLLDRFNYSVMTMLIRISDKAPEHIKAFLEIAELLLAHGANPNEKEARNRITPRQAAAKCKNKDAFIRLLDNPPSRDASGAKALAQGAGGGGSSRPMKVATPVGAVHKPVDSPTKFVVPEMPAATRDWVAEGMKTEPLESLPDDMPIDLVVLVINARELNAALHPDVLSPLPGMKRISLYRSRYWIGVYGIHCVAIVQSRMGALAATAALATALERLKPRLGAVNVGVAFGRDPVNQRLTDVLVSESVIPYDGQMRINADGTAKLRSELVRASPVLLKAFKAAAKGWELPMAVCSPSPRVQFGDLLSGSFLVDNQGSKDALFRDWPTAIGGEMEGGGVSEAATEADTGFLLMKAISDWGDGTKTKGVQPIAAYGAFAFLRHVMSSPVLAASEYKLSTPLCGRDIDRSPTEAAAPGNAGGGKGLLARLRRAGGSRGSRGSSRRKDNSKTA